MRLSCGVGSMMLMIQQSKLKLMLKSSCSLVLQNDILNVQLG